MEREWLPEIEVALPQISYGQIEQPTYPIWQWPPANWNVPSYTVDSAKHYIITDAIIHTENGVITVGEYCLRESLYLVFPETVGWGKASESEIFIPVSHSRKVEEAYHSLCGYVGNRNYAHWWIDVIPLLGHQIMRGCFGKAVALIPEIRARYQEETLALIPEIRSQYICIKENESVIADKLHFVPSVTGGDYHPQPWNWNFINKIKRDLNIDHDNRNKKRIYVSRKDATSRKLLNEDDICDAASDAGFEVLEASRLSVAEQINTFAQASHVISPHGAGLANMLFCSPGTRILELHYDMCINWSLRRLAAAGGLSYGCVIGRLTEQAVGQALWESEDGWTLPVEEFRSVIASFPYV